MKYGKLTFIEKCGKSSDKHVLWKMVCDCGQERVAFATKVRNGLVYQCNSCSQISAAKAVTKHGMRKTNTYSTWVSMKVRCLTPSNKDYPNYGAKGITVCQEWIDSFECFLKDMGNKPHGASLDRIDNTKGYYKGNCRWATRSEQQRNKSNSRSWLIKGRVFQTLSEAASFYKVTKTTIKRWVSGSFDKRTKKFTKAKDDCKQIFKY
jgi:hypothetical protein